MEGTEHKKVFLARHRQVDWAWLNNTLDDMAVACDRFDTGRLQEQLDMLVPERDGHTGARTDPPKAEVVYLKGK